MGVNISHSEFAYFAVHPITALNNPTTCNVLTRQINNPSPRSTRSAPWTQSQPRGLYTSSSPRSVRSAGTAPALTVSAAKKKNHSIFHQKYYLIIFIFFFSNRHPTDLTVEAVLSRVKARATVTGAATVGEVTVTATVGTVDTRTASRSFRGAQEIDRATGNTVESTGAHAPQGIILV